jgi:hypothetical protein
MYGLANLQFLSFQVFVGRSKSFHGIFVLVTFCFCYKFLFMPALNLVPVEMEEDDYITSFNLIFAFLFFFLLSSSSLSLFFFFSQKLNSSTPHSSIQKPLVWRSCFLGVPKS